ncbi:hypothetical protein APHNP_0223 [Anaplasma phagocytophilum str. ApNP]|uniref:Uncharacterized protein n=2 Tax=Anaplasma phagocytophilum TaxID=948 RepID=A0A0F3NHP3_ANAPH|nr:hypothetical protein APHMUC_0449 [Anaplasma phagocytophilum str. ApMUC09]KJV67568.1 hypothetical protein APHNP_0223 [Anaplasma phagocytophilum str. ApNP]
MPIFQEYRAIVPYENAALHYFDLLERLGSASLLVCSSYIRLFWAFTHRKSFVYT